MKDSVVSPSVIINLKSIDDLSGIRVNGKNLKIGATTTLAELASDAKVQKLFPALTQAAEGVSSPQIRNMGTIGGDLCQRPRCWYFRKGYGLLPRHDGDSMIKAGDNRFHAIFGNAGDAQFVNPSSFAPALIALGAEINITGPRGTRTVLLGDFYHIPSNGEDEYVLAYDEGAEKEYALADDEILVDIQIPMGETLNATYEIRQRQVLDWPLVAAAVSLDFWDRGGEVSAASVVLGHVAPVPWVSKVAAQQLEGKIISSQVAQQAGDAAIVEALPLSMNKYKVQLARVAIKRAIIKAVGMES
jgi:xanthine dehydrogenase YagS FAD-binding subunit